ncbi:MAG: hypothetical protein HPY53_14165 [Brevinematales bacterium]|nr:hypothetical protein [Brevinematales bacterium]
MPQEIFFANIFGFIFGGIGLLVTIFLGIRHNKTVLWIYLIIQLMLLSYLIVGFIADFWSVKDTPDLIEARLLFCIRNTYVFLFPYFFHTLFRPKRELLRNISFGAEALLLTGLVLSPLFYDSSTSSYGPGYIIAILAQAVAMVYVFFIAFKNVKNIDNPKVKVLLVVFSIMMAAQYVLIYGIGYLHWFEGINTPFLRETFFNPIFYMLWNIAFLWSMLEVFVLKETRPCTVDERELKNKEEANLTEREWEISIMVMEGRTAKMIAEELGISEHTVKTHVKNIYQKSGVKNRVGLTNYLKTGNNKPIAENEL